MKILVTDKLASEAVDKLKEKHDVLFEEMDHDKLVEEISKYDALVIRSRTKARKDVIENGKNLKVIGRAGVGVDNIDVDAATQRGIKVVNAPTGASQSVAELTLGLMLALVRQLPKADSSLHEGQWLKKQLKGSELYGKKLGLIGLGNIGSKVAAFAKAMGMEVIAYRRHPVPTPGVEFTSLEELLSSADIISLHLPLTPETRHFVSKKEFAQMKDGVLLVNCSRGGIVDENALYDAIKSGKVARAAMDVYEIEPPTLENNKLLRLKEVALTPHIGAATKEGQKRAGLIVAEEVLKVLDGKEPAFWVNKK
ncbi:MAG TPA: hydroxyacid dehydrogenase [Thermoplasmata archaeon]|nr:hydroxyacid dehydrogenase [Thermoplasmata archaeon]